MVEIIDNKLQQAYDFRDECNAVYSILENLKEQDYEMPTQFKGWTFNNVIGHLHVWNYAADISLKDGDEWKNFANSALQALGNGSSMNEFEQTITKGIQGPELLSMWKEYYTEMTERFAVADPKKRVKWMGPDMSVRSSISARHMETWAHAQELYDSLGLDRINEDRIKNIVIIGNNTFKWCFTVHKKTLPSIRHLYLPQVKFGNIMNFLKNIKLKDLQRNFVKL